MSQSIPLFQTEPPSDSAIWFTSFEQPEQDRHLNETRLLAFEIQRTRSSTKGLTREVADLEVTTARWFIEGLFQAFHCVPSSALALPFTLAVNLATS